MIGKHALPLLGCLAVLALGTGAWHRADAGPGGAHDAWVAESLKRIQALKAGMTRSDLLEVFATEGGLSMPSRRTYAYRDCPLIKVDVEFEAVGRPAQDAEGRPGMIESKDDLIRSISRPYLAWMVID